MQSSGTPGQRQAVQVAGQSEPGRPGPAELPAQIGPGHNEPKSPKKAGPFHVRRVFIRPETAPRILPRKGHTVTV